MQPLTAADVQATLDAFNLGIRIQFFDTSTATSQLAADNIGCALGQIVKSLAFIVDGHPIVVLASGDQRVDDRKIAALFGVSRSKVKIASADACIAIYGYAPGGVPPLGHRTQGLPIYINRSLLRYQQVYAAGGAHNAIFGLTIDQLLAISGGKIVDFGKRDGDAAGERA